MAIGDVVVFLYILCHCLFSFLYRVFFNFQDLSVENMSRYISPINPAVFPHLTVVLLGIGIFFMAWFFVYPFLEIDDVRSRYVFSNGVYSCTFVFNEVLYCVAE